MRNTEKQTLEDLLREVEILVSRDAFDNILDADTTDNLDIIRTFKNVYPERYQKAIDTAVKEAIYCGANEYRVTNAGYEMPK